MPRIRVQKNDDQLDYHTNWSDEGVANADEKKQTVGEKKKGIPYIS